MSRLDSTLGAIGRTFATLTTTAFTPATYDTVFQPTIPGMQPVTADSMLALPAAYACTVAISEDTGKVPLQMFEMAGDAKRLARDHPVYDVLHSQPNKEWTAIEFREWMTAIAVNRGRAVAEIKSKPGNPVAELWPLHPDRLHVETLPDGTQRISYNDPVKGMRKLNRQDLFVLRGRFGRGVIDYARSNIELQRAMQDAAREMYGRGLRSPGYLHTQKTLSETARKNLRAALDEYMGGGERAGRPMLLDEGMEWKSIAFTLADMEFMATLDHGDDQMCQWYRVPKHKIQKLAPGTHASLAQQGVDYVVDSILGWAVRWEQAIRRDLILEPKRYVAEHNLEGLLRGDTKSRFEAYKIAVTFGWMTRAEVRERENLNPIAGLDEPILPLNMASQVAGGQLGGMAALSDPSVVSYLRVLVRDGAARIVRKETATLAKLADKTGGTGDEWSRGVRDFYREHAEFTARVLRIPDEVAAKYADQRCASLIEGGPVLLDNPETETIADLTEVALDTSKPLQLDTGDIAA